MDQARLLPTITQKQFQSGETLFNEGDESTELFLIVSGEVSVNSEHHTLKTVSQGFLGQESVLEQPNTLYTIKANNTVTVMVFQSDELLQIMANYPNAHRDFTFSLMRLSLKETSPSNLQKNSAQTNAQTNQAQPLSDTSQFPWKTLIGWLSAFSAPMVVYNLNWDPNLSENIRIFSAGFATTLVFWTFNLMADYVAGLFLMLIVLIVGIVPANIILSGFHSSSLFMAMSIFVLSAVITASGLAYRVSLILLKHTPASKFMVNFLLTSLGMLLTPIIPSANGRVGLVSPLLTDIIRSLKVTVGGREATRMAVSAFYGLSLFSSLFLTSKSINFVLFGMLPSQVRDSFQWLDWTIAASVAGLTSLILFLILSSWMFQSSEPLQINRIHINQQLNLLGPLSNLEWSALMGIFFLIIGIATLSIHTIKPAWIGVTLMFLFLAFNVLGKSEFRKKIDWPFLMLLATLIGITQSIAFLKIDILIGEQLGGLLRMMQTQFYLFILLLALLIFILRWALSINATIIIMASIFLPLADQAGINMWIMGFMILTFSESFISPYQCSYYLLFQSLTSQQKLFNHKHFLTFNVSGLAIRLAAVYASLPFWKMLEILH